MIGPLGYIGGKRRLAPHLIRLFPPHITYVELFAGGAQVLFHKPPSRVEVLNDLDGEVVNFLRICQRHSRALADVLRWQPASRRLFEWYRIAAPETLTDIERAARFFYLQKNAWAGKRVGQNFRFAVTKPNNYRPSEIVGRLGDAADRLQNVQIEQASYEQILNRYDRPSTLFYCDPPYVGVDLYRHNFTSDGFRRLADRLAKIRGTFVLSINDCPEAREYFRAFHRQSVSLTYTATRGGAKVRELLYSNRRLTRAP